MKTPPHFTRSEFLRTAMLASTGGVLTAGQDKKGQRSLQATGNNIFDPCQFGAKPDGVTLCTEAIQRAIEACAGADGGKVLLSGGSFLSGTLFLRSHVTIEIDAGATLLGSTTINNYPAKRPGIRSYTDNYADKSLIVGENLQNIGLIGHGTIDGQGSRFGFTRRMPPFEKDRPYLIRFINCRDVLVDGLRLTDSAMWMQHYLGCERVIIRGIHVLNYKNQCSDGIELDGSKDCIVSGCIFESDDDGITLKSTFEQPCDNIIISDCIIRSHCSAIKMGTESNGGFRNITISNCIVNSPSGNEKVVNGVERGLTGIALEIVDGGQLEHITISNITIQGVTTPIFLRLGDRARPFKEGMPTPPVGSFRDIIISNIVASGIGTCCCSITGIPDHPVQNISLNNISIFSEGSVSRDIALEQVQELVKEYPECTMFGTLPAFGFYCRHVDGLRFSNIQLRTAAPDLRYAMVLDDVEELAIDGLDAYSWPDGAPVLGLVQTRGAIIRGCKHHDKAGIFIKIAGEKSHNILLIGNDLSNNGGEIELATDVPKDALTVK